MTATRTKTARSILLTVALVGATFALTAGPAAATHDDPTHGVVPHSVGDNPANIHPVDISTPHPYAADGYEDEGEVMSWAVQISGAESLSVHFENGDVAGYYWKGVCYGTWVNVTDGNTGDTLGAWCGSEFVGFAWREHGFEENFWTDHYPTDHLVITLEVGGDVEGNYGFDIYEVASDGAEAVAEYPGIPDPTVPTVEYDVDVDPEPDEGLPTASALVSVSDVGLVALRVDQESFGDQVYTVAGVDVFTDSESPVDRNSASASVQCLGSSWNPTDTCDERGVAQASSSSDVTGHYATASAGDYSSFTKAGASFEDDSGDRTRVEITEYDDERTRLCYETSLTVYDCIYINEVVEDLGVLP